VLVRVGDASATAIVSDGSFSVAEGALALASSSTRRRLLNRQASLIVQQAGRIASPAVSRARATA
jgi:hypothetical protein